MKNIDNVKSSAKTTVSVPQDFHSFLFQIEGFTLACQFIFGEESILMIQLQNLPQRLPSTTSSTKIESPETTILQGKSFGQWTNRSNFSSKTAVNVQTAKTWMRG
jgi:hypothetical protein